MVPVSKQASDLNLRIKSLLSEVIPILLSVLLGVSFTWLEVDVGGRRTVTALPILINSLFSKDLLNKFLAMV